MQGLLLTRHDTQVLERLQPPGPAKRDGRLCCLVPVLLPSPVIRVSLSVKKVVAGTGACAIFAPAESEQ